MRGWGGVWCPPLELLAARLDGVAIKQVIPTGEDAADRVGRQVGDLSCPAAPAGAMPPVVVMASPTVRCAYDEKV